MALVYNDFGLGREKRFDTRSLKFAAPAPKSVYDTPGAVVGTFKRSWHGDQGREPQCVGYSLAAMLRTSPYQHKHLGPTQVYLGAQKDDEWAGENYEGSSVLGGCRYLSKITDIEGNHVPEIASYHSLPTIDAMVLWMRSRKSSVVVGTDWDLNMFEVDARGYVKRGGRTIGGHAYHIYGFDMRYRDPERDYFFLQNSWGQRWGIRGLAKISFAHMADLLDRAGEAWGVDKINFRRVGHYPGRRGAVQG